MTYFLLNQNFYQNMNFWWKCHWPSFRFVAKIWIFDQNFSDTLISVAFLIFDEKENRWHLRRDENVFQLSSSAIVYFDSNAENPENLNNSKCYFGGKCVKAYVGQVSKYIMVSCVAPAGCPADNARKQTFEECCRIFFWFFKSCLSF